MLILFKQSHTFQTFVKYLLVSALAVLCYINSSWGSFVFDDSEAILQNKDVNPDTPISNVFKNDFWGTNISDKDSHKSYRPLTVLTFRWNYWLGGLEPFGYHLANVLLHAVVSMTFLQVCSCLDEDWKYSNSAPSKKGHSWFALFAALLFAVHPVHAESVSGTNITPQCNTAFVVDISILSTIIIVQLQLLY